MADLPMGSVVEGEIVDVEAVSRSVRELWRRAGVRGKNVAIGVSNQKVVVRLIDLPYMERAELEGAIKYQAQDYVPIPVEDAILDFQILSDYMTPGDEHMMEVLLVAASRDMIQNAVSAVEGAGLKLDSIDVTPFAIVRALLGDEPEFLPEESAEGPESTGIIHVSSGITNIVVVERGIPRFTRVSSLAGNEFTQSIANILNMTFDEAEQIKLMVGLPSVDGQPTPPPEGIDPHVYEQAQEALEREASKFVAEVRRSLDYYLTQTAQIRTIRRILLTGSSAQLGNLPQYLEKGLQAEVVLADPLPRLGLTSSVTGIVEADRMGCAPVVGLAMRGAE
jgi:type IV pilus assembly protein PilM